VKIRHRYGRWTLSRVDANNKETAAGVFATKREAIAARDALLVDKRRGRYVEPSSRTLADWWAEWSASRKNLSPGSRAVEGVYWSRWILPHLGELGIQQLGPAD